MMKKFLFFVLCVIVVVCVIAFTPLKNAFNTAINTSMDKTADWISQQMNAIVAKQSEKYLDEYGRIVLPTDVDFYKYVVVTVEGKDGEGELWMTLDFDKCIAENYQNFHIDYNDKQQVAELKAFLEENMWIKPEHLHPEYVDGGCEYGAEGQLINVSNGDIVRMSWYGNYEEIMDKYNVTLLLWSK